MLKIVSVKHLKKRKLCMTEPGMKKSAEGDEHLMTVDILTH